MAEQSLLAKFKLRIQDNVAAGRRYRDGIPSQFTASDGKVYALSHVDRYVNSGFKKNPTFKDVEKNKLVKANRAHQIDIQTPKNVEKFDWKNKPKGWDAHHKRMVNMFAPFYKGKTEAEQRELTQWFADEGYALGDAKSNLKLLRKKIHNAMHSWMQENNIQVPAGKPGQSNFTTNRKGQRIVRGGADGEVVKGNKPGLKIKNMHLAALPPNMKIRNPGSAIMPDLSHLSLNETLAAASIFLKYVQDPIEQKLRTIGQEVDSTAPSSIKIKAQRPKTLKTPRTLKLIQGGKKRIPVNARETVNAHRGDVYDNVTAIQDLYDTAGVDRGDQNVNFDAFGLLQTPSIGKV